MPLNNLKEGKLTPYVSTRNYSPTTMIEKKNRMEHLAGIQNLTSLTIFIISTYLSNMMQGRVTIIRTTEIKIK